MDDYGLFFFISDEQTDDAFASFESLYTARINECDWSVAAPEFVDDTSEEEAGVRRIVGGFLPLPPPSNPRSAELETKALGDVELVMSLLASVSRELQCEFEVYLAQEYVGDVSLGNVSQSIQIGLIDEWRKGI